MAVGANGAFIIGELIMTEVIASHLIRQRYLDLDLTCIDLFRGAKTAWDRTRRCNDDPHHDQLSDHEGRGAPIEDLRGPETRGCHAPQKEQRKTTRRVHERGLHVDTEQHTEPDEIDTKLIGDGRKQWDDNESKFEKIQE
jgi:hypothetical protein